ncbi:MAG: hypothetical protein OZ915_02510 [Ignavibacteriales bacterium]|jgi:hypothetical protein|nr:hypothetical protein [Ignavibacteriaceae bacterium]MEB2354024.1 hypothetical protein [Ignavibacteriales bacterium]GIK20857.1 MAG: hypothetical protein BroJett005_02710 [Ignavibacteriota bacterium]HMN17554.1 hypothetical protein [Ignavibacteriaceae bacterium]
MPGNDAGNVNDPIQDNKTNYYSLIIFAENLTTDISAITNFNLNTTKTLLTITDFDGGSILFTIRDKYGITLYNFSAESEVKNEFRKMTNGIPGKVELKFKNFSGRLKFSLSYFNE